MVKPPHIKLVRTIAYIYISDIFFKGMKLGAAARGKVQSDSNANWWPNRKNRDVNCGLQLCCFNDDLRVVPDRFGRGAELSAGAEVDAQPSCCGYTIRGRGK